MSSLMQFRGHSDRRGVGLQFVLIKKEHWFVGDLKGLTRDVDVERVPCKTCGKDHARLHIAYRKPVGMFGCWVVFRYNGEKQVPDLSVPISIEKLPRDAKPVTDEENEKYWHS